MELWNLEFTDTFAGDANYSWVKRGTIAVVPCEPDSVYTSAAGVARKHAAYRRDIVRKAKAFAGLTGVRGRSYWHGDSWEFRPYGMAVVLFADWTESEFAHEIWSNRND